MSGHYGGRGSSLFVVKPTSHALPLEVEADAAWRQRGEGKRRGQAGARGLRASEGCRGRWRRPSTTSAIAQACPRAREEDVWVTAATNRSARLRRRRRRARPSAPSVDRSGKSSAMRRFRRCSTLTTRARSSPSSGGSAGRRPATSSTTAPTAESWGRAPHRLRQQGQAVLARGFTMAGIEVREVPAGAEREGLLRSFGQRGEWLSTVDVDRLSEEEAEVIARLQRVDDLAIGEHHRRVRFGAALTGTTSGVTASRNARRLEKMPFASRTPATPGGPTPAPTTSRPRGTRTKRASSR